MKTTDKPLLDSNILLYSVNADSPFHTTALDLLERREIIDELARKICKDLDVPFVR